MWKAGLMSLPPGALLDAVAGSCLATSPDGLFTCTAVSQNRARPCGAGPIFHGESAGRRCSNRASYCREAALHFLSQRVHPVHFARTTSPARHLVDYLAPLAAAGSSIEMIRAHLRRNASLPESEVWVSFTMFTI